MRAARVLHSHAVWPPLVLTAGFVLLYGVSNGAVWLLDYAVIKPYQGQSLSGSPEVTNARKAMLGLAAGAYSVFRLLRFHPACNPGYASWLRLSPWTASKRLPFGPIHLVWQDAVVIGALCAIAFWHARVNPAMPAIVFGLMYLATMTALLGYTRRWTACFVLGFLWPAMLLPMEGSLLAALGIAMAAVAWRGIAASLREFPWDFLPLPMQASAKGHSIWQTDISVPTIAQQARTSRVGWPLMALSPSLRSPSVSASAVISLLIGWSTFCVLTRTKTPALSVTILVVAIVLAMVRVAIYWGGVAAPFSILGRIVTGRFIVPRFDQVFVTPVAAVLLAAGGVMLIRVSGEWHAVAESLVMAGVMFVLMSGGPTLQQWLLTGQHRYRTPSAIGMSKQVLRQV